MIGAGSAMGPFPKLLEMGRPHRPHRPPTPDQQAGAQAGVVLPLTRASLASDRRHRRGHRHPRQLGQGRRAAHLEPVEAAVRCGQGVTRLAGLPALQAAGRVRQRAGSPRGLGLRPHEAARRDRQLARGLAEEPAARRQ
eukprot:scaffold117140_cov36-Phaeocystis_antarctica.AAC.1